MLRIVTIALLKSLRLHPAPNDSTFHPVDELSGRRSRTALGGIAILLSLTLGSPMVPLNQLYLLSEASVVRIGRSVQNGDFIIKVNGGEFYC